MGQGLVGLGGAVGAGQALERLLARRFQEQQALAQQQQQQAQLAEEQRQAQAREQLGQQTLQEQTAFRQTQQQALEQERLRDEAFRQQQLGQQKELSQSGLAQTKSIQDMLEQGRNERGAEAGQSRLELARLTASLRQPPSEPLYPVDINGQIVYLPRSQAAGRSAPPPASARTDLARGATSMANLDRVAELFRPEYVGPLVGRARSIGQQIPGVPVNEGFSEFESEVATLRNTVIKAITGAQMSEPEARRIMQQIPNVNDKTEVFLARMNATRRNLMEMQARMRGPYGGAPISPLPAH